MHNIGIVCIGYNRSKSLESLLASLDAASYPENASISLIISLDYHPSEPCIDLANQFVWKYGSKRVIAHKQNLGLKKHVLSCGDLVSEFDAILVFEDDLLVSPYFYHYSLQAIQNYEHDERIAGIALFSPVYSQNAQRIFTPFQTNHSAYFLQFPCSWGQIWTKKQWFAFRDWLEQSESLNLHEDLPVALHKWSNQSWLKLFASYLLHSGKTWVYPTTSLTTILSSYGEHFHGKEFASAVHLLFHVPLLRSMDTFHFPQLGETIAEYDIYHENCSPLFMKQIGVDANEVEFDLYGMKPLNSYRKPKLITSKSVRKSEKSYGLVMKPQEENILSNVKGNYFALAQKEDILDRTKRKLNWYLFTYWVGGTFSLMDMLRLSWERFKIRVGL